MDDAEVYIVQGRYDSAREQLTALSQTIKGRLVRGVSVHRGPDTPVDKPRR